MAVYHREHSVEAWNMDGSADARAESGSWIREAEVATGRRRGRCSYEGCGRPAEVGGHVWIKQSGCFIAPICSRCNHPNNVTRMQGANARLRANIDVTETEQTWGMLTAPRRFAVAVRECDACGTDISDRPDHHEVCLSCFRSKKRGHKRKRRCESCSDDISDRPENHTLCLSCFRTEQTINVRSTKRQIAVATRHCEVCGADIAHRPDSHNLCLSCFKSEAQGHQDACSKRSKSYEEYFDESSGDDDYGYDSYGDDY